MYPLDGFVLRKVQLVRFNTFLHGHDLYQFANLNLNKSNKGNKRNKDNKETIKIKEISGRIGYKE